jgi:hypothetical protein
MQHMLLNGTMKQLKLIQTQLDHEWDMSSPMQDAPCIGQLKFKLK